MTILPNPQILIVSFQAPEFFPLAVMPPDNSHMEMKCDLKWMCTCLSLLFPFFILFIFIFLARPVMIDYSLKDLARKMHSRQIRTLQSDTERAKEESGENIPSGCSVWVYVGMMSFVFTKPGLNLFLPLQNCSAEHLWRLLQTIFQAFESARCIKIQPIARGSLALPSLCLFPLPEARVCCSREVTAQRPPGSSCPAPIEASRQASNGLKANLAKTRADFWPSSHVPLTGR